VRTGGLRGSSPIQDREAFKMKKLLALIICLGIGSFWTFSTGASPVYVTGPVATLAVQQLTATWAVTSTFTPTPTSTGTLTPIPTGTPTGTPTPLGRIIASSDYYAPVTFMNSGMREGLGWSLSMIPSAGTSTGAAGASVGLYSQTFPIAQVQTGTILSIGSWLFSTGGQSFGSVSNNSSFVANGNGIIAKPIMTQTPVASIVWTWVYQPFLTNSDIPEKYRHLFEINPSDPYSNGHNYCVMYRVIKIEGMKIICKPVSIHTWG
jgi:hypothetical protein